MIVKHGQLYLENMANISSNQFLADLIDLKIRIPDESTVVNGVLKYLYFSYIFSERNFIANFVDLSGN